MRRHRQAVDFARHHLVRLAAVAGGVVEFRQPVTQLVAAGEKQQRIVTAGDQHRAGLAMRVVLVADLPALLAGRDVDRDVVLVVHHAAIGRGVDPAAVGVAHDHEIVGGHVAAAVLLVQERDREFEQVDLVVAVDVLEHRAGAHGLGRDRLVLLHALAIGLTTSSGQDGTGRPMVIARRLDELVAPEMSRMPFG